MALARPSLTVTPEYLEANECWVAEVDGAVAGWFSLVPVADGLLLDNFFVVPSLIGSGVGGLMWEQAVRRGEGGGAGGVAGQAETPRGGALLRDVGPSQP